MATPAPQASFKRILVAVDGSEHGVRAARVAGRLARALGAHLSILTVFRAPSRELGEPRFTKAMNKMLDDAHDLAEQAGDAVREEDGPEPEIQCLDGEPAATIIRHAREAQADMIVVGTRGRGRIQAAVLGSVSQEVATGAGRPVLVIGLDEG